MFELGRFDRPSATPHGRLSGRRRTARLRANNGIGQREIDRSAGVSVAMRRGRVCIAGLIEVSQAQSVGERIFSR